MTHIHTETLKFKGKTIQKIETNGQTDRWTDATDCFAFPVKAGFHVRDRHRHRHPREDCREEIARVGRKDVVASGESVSVS